MREDVLRGICADRYDVDKIPAAVDTVVIGSGMSGLTCAAVLSRMGQTVLVLEQHYVAGGGSHMFELKGGLRFDSGLHYLVPYSGLLMWRPDFDASQPAAYYARVLEIPTPRWTAYEAKRYALDLPDEIEMTTQERAYTSPIWYTPAGK